MENVPNSKNIINNKIDRDSMVLNLGAGKLEYDFIFCETPNILINVDQSYTIDYDSDPGINGIKCKNIKSDIFNFMDSYPYKFNIIIANRIFEHMFYDSGEIGRLLSSCHYLLQDKGTMFILVPNHELLSSILIKKSMTSNDLLLLNTEFCNTKSDPHGSIWTPTTAVEYINTEGVWDIIDIYRQVRWDGRTCYMLIELIKKG